MGSLPCPRLATLPALRNLAVEEARARLILSHPRGADPSSHGHDEWTEALHTRTAVEVALHSDLTRPASRDAMVRLIDIHGDADDRHLARVARDDAATIATLAIRVLGAPNAIR